MPGTRESLKQQVRAITNYLESTITDERLETLVDIGIAEIRAEVGDNELSFFGDDGGVMANRALFWLTALFCKISGGELGGAGFEIGSLRTTSDTNGGESGIWMSRFESKLISISDNFGMGSVKINRPNREYSNESV